MFLLGLHTSLDRYVYTFENSTTINIYYILRGWGEKFIVSLWMSVRIVNLACINFKMHCILQGKLTSDCLKKKCSLRLSKINQQHIGHHHHHCKKLSVTSCWGTIDSQFRGIEKAINQFNTTVSYSSDWNQGIMY